MKNSEIEKIANKDASDFWLRPEYSRYQYALFIDKLLESQIVKRELPQTHWRNIRWDEKTRTFRHPTIKYTPTMDSEKQ